MEDNLLVSGVQALYQVRNDLNQLEEYKLKTADLEALENKLELKSVMKEDSIREEINNVLNKRKEEMGDTFDVQLNLVKGQIKKIRNKKDKMRDQKVSKRIEDETIELRESNYALRQELKSLFKNNHISFIWNTNLYNAIFSPISFKDIFVILIAFLLLFLAIPCGIYYYLLPEQKSIYLVIIYLLTVLIWGGIYFSIHNITKNKNLDVFEQAKDLRIQIKKNNTEVMRMKRHIIKDKDESLYGLNQFDDELNELEEKLVLITEEKNTAMEEFDNKTKMAIESEIWSQNQEELTTMRQEHQQTHRDAQLYSEKQKELSLKISKRYEAYIGQEFISVDKIDALIQLLETQGEGTISDAIQMYKQSR